MRWSFNRGFLDGVNMAILARVEEIDRRVVSDRTIDSHVKKLRRKFAAAARGPGVFLQAFPPFGPRDRKDVPGQQPCQGELGGTAFPFRGDLLEACHEG